MPDVLWNRLKASDLRRLAQEGAVVLLPVASTEQHGPHLATGVDVVLCTEVCRRAAAMVPAPGAVVAPTVWMGLAEHHVAFGGSFSVSLSTWHAILRELCQSILRAGFSRILIVNGHGGNMTALNALTVDLTREVGAPIATTNYFSFAEPAFSVLEDQDGIQHACEGETSMMMAAAPDLVDTAELVNAHGPNVGMSAALARKVHVWTSFREMTPSGVFGDARRADAQKGERLLDAAAQGLAEHLRSGRVWP